MRARIFLAIAQPGSSGDMMSILHCAGPPGGRAHPYSIQSVIWACILYPRIAAWPSQAHREMGDGRWETAWDGEMGRFDEGEFECSVRAVVVTANWHASNLNTWARPDPMMAR